MVLLLSIPLIVHCPLYSHGGGQKAHRANSHLEGGSQKVRHRQAGRQKRAQEQEGGHGHWLGNG